MKTKMYKIIFSSLIIALSFGVGTSYAANNIPTPTPNNYTDSYMPHVYLYGFTGSSVTGKGDILQPIFLRSDRNFFAYGQGNYGYADEDWAKNPWTGSFALGYRQIVSNAAILGAYVFGDYTRTTIDHSIWLVSPGIEALGKVWEFHANGYFPVSKKNWSTTEFASEVGNYDYVSFRGHDQFDAKLKFNEETGPGADAELGRTLFRYHNTLVTGFINGYYFHMQDNTDIRGGGGAIAIQPNNYLELSVNGSYDNYAHTVVMLGIQLSLYDLFSNNSKILNEKDLQWRLFDPIRRGFANLASGSDVRTIGGPRDEETRKEPGPVILGHNFLKRSNIWFFNGAGLSQTQGVGVAQDVADGTYEHPFAGPDFNQETVQQIYDDTLATGAYTNAYLYFNKGIYNTFDTAGIGASYVRLELFPGESMWGRMGNHKGFQEPATGTNRPDFIGGLMLDSNTSVNNLILQNNYAVTGFDTGITMNGATNVEINDSQIGIDGPGDGGYHTGVSMENNSSLTISGSDIYGYNAEPISPPWPDVNAFGVGLEVKNGGDVTAINHSLIEGHSVNGSGIGLYVVPTTDGSGNVESKIGNISGDKTADFTGTGEYGFGLFAWSRSFSGTASTTIGAISNSNFTGTSTGSAGVGLFAASSSNSGTAATTIGAISNSNFTGTSTGSAGVGLYAVSWSSSGASTTIGAVTGNKFTASDTGVFLLGSTVKVNGATYTGPNNPSALYNYLINNGNTFAGSPMKYVCINWWSCV